MKLGALFSGGKDSCLAVYKAKNFHEIACLITMIPKSEESYMFHVPNIHVTFFQAKAMGLPIMIRRTSGEKTLELTDLYRALKDAIREYGIEGVLTGAIRSIYQASNVQKICNKLGLWCFNPLWLKDQLKLLYEILDEGFTAIISGVYAYPLDESFLGKTIDANMIKRLEKLQQAYDLNIAGEGGEIETTVLDAPFFKKRIEIVDYEIKYRRYSGTFIIKDLRLTDK